MSYVRLASSAALAALLASFATSCAGGRDTGGSACGECGPFTSCCEQPDGTHSCVRTSDSPTHCGTCGNACASGRCMSGMCVGGSGDGGSGFDSGPTGMCSPSCSSAQRCCGTSCVDRSVPTGTDGRTSSSFTNCNGCGLTCNMDKASACSAPSGMSGPPRCMCGTFNECTGSDVCVTSSSGGFQCVNLSTDTHNCGEIGHECGEGELCSGGSCVCGGTGASCPTGQACCGGSCIDVSTDPDNCGSCGNACGDQGTSCMDGACRCGSGPGCTPAAGTALGQLCCADTCVPQDASNCGGCGMACADGESCALGMTLTGTMDICCTTVAIPGFPSFCLGGGFGDAGIFPSLDAGI